MSWSETISNVPLASWVIAQSVVRNIVVWPLKVSMPHAFEVSRRYELGWGFLCLSLIGKGAPVFCFSNYCQATV